MNKRAIIDNIPAYNKTPLSIENAFIIKIKIAPISIIIMFILFEPNKSNTAKNPKTINKGIKLIVISPEKSIL